MSGRNATDLDDVMDEFLHQEVLIDGPKYKHSRKQSGRKKQDSRLLNIPKLSIVSLNAKDTLRDSSLEIQQPPSPNKS